MRTYKPAHIVSFANNASAELYVYSIVSLSTGIVALGSDDSIRLFSHDSLRPISKLPSPRTKSPYSQVLKPVDESTVATASADGVVRFWDTRANTLTHEYRVESTTPVRCLEVDKPHNRFAAGAEVDGSEARLHIW